MEIYREAKRLKKDDSLISVTPMHLAQIASGGADRSQIFRWLNQNLNEESNESEYETRGRLPVLSEDQEALLVGFAVAQRSSLKPVALATLQKFCKNYLSAKPSYATISHILAKHGFSSQKAMARSSRMTTEEVVYDAIEALEDLRSYGFSPHRIICMDETGLWSNVVAPRTFHFRNW